MKEINSTYNFKYSKDFQDYQNILANYDPQLFPTELLTKNAKKLF